ncbi:leucyl aminopeptidase [Myxococcota bacterium]|nr:leucyl aminopeptidase [Myxococcota bacterium]
MDYVTTSADIAGIACDLLAIGVRQGQLDAALSVFEPSLARDLAAAAQADEFDGKPGALALWPALGRLAAPRLALVGLGDGSTDAVRRGAGAAASAARNRGVTRLVLALGDLDTERTIAAVEGVEAGAYRYDRFKAEDARKAPIGTVAFAGSVDTAAIERAKAIAVGQRLARDLVNGPAADVYPETLAAEAAQLAGDGMTVEVWDEQQIRAAGMGGITAVGQGSERPARFVHMTWKPAGAARRKLVLVGKGVTFDSGGLSLKPTDGMKTMRCDMAGSAAVIGVMRAVRDLRPDVEVHGIFGAVENMNSGGAYKLGDILTMYNGKTVEIHNTDAEGRLVLADCLSYADKLGADAIVDLATLTGAAVIALGSDYSALYSDNEALAAQLLTASDAAGESLWRMPLPEHYKEQLKADWATLKNIGGREGGSITAALFLKEFVEKTPWAHCDIAGPAFREKAFRHLAAGASGVMVPSLVRWILA